MDQGSGCTRTGKFAQLIRDSRAAYQGAWRIGLMLERAMAGAERRSPAHEIERPPILAVVASGCGRSLSNQGVGPTASGRSVTPLAVGVIRFPLRPGVASRVDVDCCVICVRASQTLFYQWVGIGELASRLRQATSLVADLTLRSIAQRCVSKGGRQACPIHPSRRHAPRGSSG